MGNKINELVLKNIIKRHQSKLIGEFNFVEDRKTGPSDWMKPRHIEVYLKRREAPPLVSFLFIKQCAKQDLSDPLAAWKVSKDNVKPLGLTELPHAKYGQSDGENFGSVSFCVAEEENSLYEEEMIGPLWGSRYSFQIKKTIVGIKLSNKKTLVIY